MTKEGLGERGRKSMFPKTYDPIYVTVKVKKHSIQMKVDTETSLSVISEATLEGDGG